LRQGTHSTKNRSNVRGTTRKGAPQKGRGKARIGSLRAAQFRGGGVVFGPKPRSHATSLPVLVRELALRSALATKFRQNQIVFTNPIKLESHKTKDLLPALNYYKPMSLSGLSEAERTDEKLLKAANNLPDVKVIGARHINVYDLLKHEYCIVDEHARKWLEERLVP
ncbi:ribosomal protein L4/L1 family protein, partial [Paraphysoderma sedebokerense]